MRASYPVQPELSNPGDSVSKSRVTGFGNHKNSDSSERSNFERIGLFSEGPIITELGIAAREKLRAYSAIESKLLSFFEQKRLQTQENPDPRSEIQDLEGTHASCLCL
jgi:hypothetical protein